jgi:hypothetical protein
MSRFFWNKVDRSGECWIWTASRNKSGYGQVKRDGRMQLAHRASYVEAFGAIPLGLHVLHRCDTPACVRPSHLFVGTHADNMADMVKKGRSNCRREAEHPMAKLTAEAAKCIFQRVHSGESKRSLAAEFGVTRRLVRQIAIRAIWQQTNSQAAA